MDMIKIEEEMKLIEEWWSPYIYTLRARAAFNKKVQSYEFLEETFGEKSDLVVEIH